MAHGIFPNFGPSFIKDICKYLSKKEAKDVFYTTKKERKALEKKRKEEEVDLSKDKKRKKR